MLSRTTMWGKVVCTGVTHFLVRTQLTLNNTKPRAFFLTALRHGSNGQQMWCLRLREQQTRQWVGGQTQWHTGGAVSPPPTNLHPTVSTSHFQHWRQTMWLLFYSGKNILRLQNAKRKKQTSCKVLALTDGCRSSWLSGWVCHRTIWINIPGLSCASTEVKHVTNLHLK